MELTSEQREYFSKHQGATMTTLRADGTPHTVRVGSLPGKRLCCGSQLALQLVVLQRPEALQIREERDHLLVFGGLRGRDRQDSRRR